MEPIQPGKSTSEFLLSAVSSAVSASVALVAIIHPGFKLDDDTKTLVASLAVLVIGLVTGVYSHGRSQIKQAAINATQASFDPLLNSVDPSSKQVFAKDQGPTPSGGQF